MTSSEDLLDNTEKILDFENKTIEAIKDLSSHASAKKVFQDKIAAVMAEITHEMECFKNLHDKMPGDIENMMKTLQEMKNGSEPNDTADYWEEKKKIEKHTLGL